MFDKSTTFIKQVGLSNISFAHDYVLKGSKKYSNLYQK